MKGARNSENKQNKQGYTHKPKPDVRDDMDSRHTKDDQFKKENALKKKTKK
ncbi:MAG: hypothetical protein ACHQFW_05810 [Chitinophagales bacterium]